MKNYQYSVRLSYYDGLTLVQLDGSIDDCWLIVCIEAAWYCSSRGVESIRFNTLRARSDEVLNLLTNGKRTNLGGSFQRILESRRYAKFFRVEQVNKNETRIYPNIPAIQDEVRCRKVENLASRDKRLIRIINSIDTVHCDRSIIESPTVSARLDVVVIRGDSKEKSHSNVYS